MKTIKKITEITTKTLVLTWIPYILYQFMRTDESYFFKIGLIISLLILQVNLITFLNKKNGK